MSDVEYRADHYLKPERGDDEDYVDYLARTDGWDQGVPAPPGFERVECSEGHYPLFVPTDDDTYPAPCMYCAYAAATAERRQDCKAKHRRWKSWKVVGWLASKAYVLGVIASCGTWFGRCEFCGIERQATRPRWRGRRVYALGLMVDDWRCLRRGHRRRESIYSRGICTICLPCPDCGSDAAEHFAGSCAS